MKAKFASKSVISIVLSLLMVISMVTVGIVSATSAQVDVAESAASTMEVYFTKPSNWSAVKLHYWGGASSTNWPGADMTKKYTNDMNEDVYYLTIPGDTTGIIFNNGSGTQTADLTVTGKSVVAYYWNGSAAVLWPDQPAPSGSGSSETTAPTDPPADAPTVYFADCSSGRWIESDEATILANDVAMTKSIDEHTGHTVWYAKIAVNNGGNVTFKRVSKLNNSTVWNTWSGTFYTANPCYNADGDSGSFGTAPTLPAGTATDYWYGIWADPKGDGNVKDFVKIYAADYYTSPTDYYLYLPSYANRSALKIYTALYDLKIGGVSVPRATATTLNLTGSTYSISYKRYTTGSTHNDKLHVISTTGTSALLLTTKTDLYAGLTSAYAVQADGSTPDFNMISAYKDSTSNKGDYLCYDAQGKLLNATDKVTGEPLTGLKKIKGRGNSTFEASMRLYGKYAYNITLTDKAKLIAGCESSKKYSLLANNADESLMRNYVIYDIADTIGMPYTPNTRLVDMFDNGNYIGAYVLTEKVEYGKNTLIPDAKSLDKTNEDILAEGKGIDYDGLKQKEATYTAKSGTTYRYQYSYNPSGAAYEFDGTTVTIGEGEEAETYTLDETYMKKHDFLLEHEIDARYGREATWFISNRTKQAVVPKYPEFATQKEVQWMIEEYDALETAVHNKNYAAFSQIADAETFADVYLIQELTMNLDACATSYNILGGGSYDKLMAAPLWDYDWTSGQYNGKKLTTDGQVDVGDYSKVFVKKKSVKIESGDSRTQSVPNLQAKMTQMSDFWNLCKKEWTNDFVPVLNSYLGDNNTLLGVNLPLFRSAANMNESRWGAMAKNYAGARSSDPMAATWGTRSTSGYVKGSNNFGIGSFYAGSSASNYDSTVYFLNDWLTKRQANMSTSMGLYDASLIEPDPTEPPTEAPTAAPTDAPTDAPTEAPTDAPTDAPTEAPTQPSTDKPYDPETEFLLGDVDGDGIITVMDATKLQQIIAGYTDGFSDVDKMGQRSKISSETLSIMDATSIQRYCAGYDDGHGIGAVKPY